MKTLIKRLNDLYGPAVQQEQMQRYHSLAVECEKLFGKADEKYFVSSPGRTELGGNHTDHNHGRVLCAAVSQDLVALVEARQDNLVKLNSSAFDELFVVDLAELSPQKDESGTTNALIRGVAAGFRKKGFETGGFNAVVHSNVFIGSGLSSSASFEVLIGGIFNTLYNEGQIDSVTLAKIGQYAENEFFDKPCGLMDQLGCAVGGVLAVDFEDNENPVVEKLDVDFGEMDYTLAVIDTGGSHANLTPAYASIPYEMKQVAALFQKSNLREVAESLFKNHLPEVKKRCGDRALLRSLHFFAETRRVEQMVETLKTGNFQCYLQLVAQSGASSSTVLQNTIPPGNAGDDQPAALAIGLSNGFFQSKGRGVARIHGGGFAGTIQVYVHKEDLNEYRAYMEQIFGKDSFSELHVRSEGIVSFSAEE